MLQLLGVFLMNNYRNNRDPVIDNQNINSIPSQQFINNANAYPGMNPFTQMQNPNMINEQIPNMQNVHIDGNMV
jgi:hypothetical protein